MVAEEAVIVIDTEVFQEVLRNFTEAVIFETRIKFTETLLLAATLAPLHPLATESHPLAAKALLVAVEVVSETGHFAIVMVGHHHFIMEEMLHRLPGVVTHLVP